MTLKMSKKVKESRSLMVVLWGFKKKKNFVFHFLELSFLFIPSAFQVKTKDFLICTTTPDSLPSGDHTLLNS